MIPSGAALSVRQAVLADLPTIVELRLALLREYAGHLLYGRLRADAEQRAFDAYRKQLQASDQVMLLAEREAAVLGIARCLDAMGSPLLHPERYCYVSSVYVRPAARRTGVLRALLDHAERWCRARGLTEMRLQNSSSNEEAIASWEALHFEVVEQVRIKRVEHVPNA